MTELFRSALRHLEKLVAFDTQNPPREIDDGGIFSYLRTTLGGDFTFDVRDLGEGCVIFHAVRGNPRLLFNVHLDTVPANEDWSHDPFTLKVTPDHAIGLGACDIKGAAACLLAVIEHAEPDDVAVLFTSDEEAGSSRCVRTFLADDHDYDLIVVGEPTRCQAISQHRGITTETAIFSGTPGHASSGRADQDSALHHAVDWAHAMLERARRWELETTSELPGIRLNLGRIEGGIKPNVIAARSTVRWGFRPPADVDPDDVLDTMHAVAPEHADVEFRPGFRAPALPVANAGASAAQRAARAAERAEELGLERGTPVDFWTEAALFSAAGYDAFVFGPGDIAQAHTAHEWVALDDLRRALTVYARMVGGVE